MLRLLRYIFYVVLLLHDVFYRLLRATDRHSIKSYNIQSAIEDICPRLSTAKCILLYMVSALNSSHRHRKLSQSIVELAGKVICRISDLVQPVEESSQLHENIRKLESVLIEVQAFVLLEIQTMLLFDDDLAIRHSELIMRLISILDTFERTWGNMSPYDDKISERVNHKMNNPHQASRTSAILDKNSNSEGNAEGHRSSLFSGAHHFVSNGGKYYSILGNYTQIDSGEKKTPKGIVDGLRVFADDGISLGREIYKGPGYRFHSARSSGKVVILKLYEGNRAKERSLRSAMFHRKVMHPNIPHMIAVSPLESERSFLVFNGDYAGVVDQLLEQILKKGLEQSLAIGMQTVSSLAAGLNYLEDQNYPFKAIPTLDHFVLLSCKGKTIISFDPEDLDLVQNEQSEQFHGALDVFHRLCQRTFKTACNAHYESREEERAFIEEIEADKVEEDIHPTTASNPIPEHSSLEKPCQNQNSNGRRWELVWKPSAVEDITLNDISRNFQTFLGDHSSYPPPALSRRRGRSSARTPHRCPGYNRIEITLTTDIARSAIVSHSSPTPHEICPVCKEVVKDAEIFNCVCGGRDDESMSTIRCSSCFEWHHRPCVNSMDLSSHSFMCPDCKGHDDSIYGYSSSSRLAYPAVLMEFDAQNDAKNGFKMEEQRLLREAEIIRLSEKNVRELREQARAAFLKRRMLLSDAADDIVEWRNGPDGPKAVHSDHGLGNAAIPMLPNKFASYDEPLRTEQDEDRKWGGLPNRADPQGRAFDHDHSMSPSDNYSRVSSVLSFATVDSDPGPRRPGLQNRSSFYGISRVTSSSSLRESSDDVFPSTLSNTILLEDQSVERSFPQASTNSHLSGRESTTSPYLSISPRFHSSANPLQSFLDMDHQLS